jgi:hypothetical protein
MIEINGVRVAESFIKCETTLILCFPNLSSREDRWRCHKLLFLFFFFFFFNVCSSF